MHLAKYLLAGLNGLVGGMAIGMVNYGFGVFVNGIAQSNPTWSRTSISGALSVMSICAGSVSPLVGTLLDKFGLVIVIPCSILLQLGGFICLSQTQSIEMLYLSYIAVGLGHAGTANLGVGKAVGELFPGPDKGRVMGVVTACNNLSGLIFTQVTTAIAQGAGWQAAARVFAQVLFILCLVYFFTMRKFYKRTLAKVRADFEEQKGIDAAEEKRKHVKLDEDVGTALGTQDVDPALSVANSEAKIESITSVTETKPERSPFLAALCSAVFVVTALGSMCAEYTYNGVLSQIIPALVAEGMTELEAAQVVSLVAALGVASKLCCGVISEKITAKRALALCMVVEGISLLFLAAFAPMTQALWVCTAFYGASFGGVGALRPLVVLETFGNGFFGRIYGVILLMFLIPALTAPIVAGVSFDRTKRYMSAFTAASVVFFVGAVLLELAGYLVRKRDMARRDFEAGIHENVPQMDAVVLSTLPTVNEPGGALTDDSPMQGVAITMALNKV